MQIWMQKLAADVDADLDANLDAKLDAYLDATFDFLLKYKIFMRTPTPPTLVAWARAFKSGGDP